MEWYAIQTYSGSERSVGEAIRNLIKENQMQDRFGEVVSYEFLDEFKEFLRSQALHKEPHENQ